MFTGIVEEMGYVVEATPTRLVIRAKVTLEGTRVGEVIQELMAQCDADGDQTAVWMDRTIGRDTTMVLMRKAVGNTVLTPGQTFGRLSPALAENERFALDAMAQVG